MSRVAQYIFIALAIIFVTTTIIFFNKSETLEKENKVITQNYLAEKDSIEKLVDSVSVAYEKLSFINKDLSDSVSGLNFQLQLKVKKYLA